MKNILNFINNNALIASLITLLITTIIQIIFRRNDRKYNEKIENYTVHEQIKKIEIPIFIIHDKNDLDVPYSASENIHRNAKNSKLLLTEKLGHRKILGDSKVIAEIKEFVSKKI